MERGKGFYEERDRVTHTGREEKSNELASLLDESQNQWTGWRDMESLQMQTKEEKCL